jgi:STE24 endopeptidase
MTEKKSTEREVWAEEYDRIHNRMFVLQIVLVTLLLVAFQWSGSSALLAEALANHFEESWYLTNASYVIVAVVGFSACMFPLSYYSGYVLEHHYELSTEDLGDWIGDYIKSLAIDILLSTLFFSIIYALLRWIPDWWWLFATLFYIFFAVVLASIFPVFIMPLFHTFEPLEEGDLTEAVRTMMTEAGIKVVGVYKWGLKEKTSTANAAFTGTGKTRRIILGDTLLKGYSKEEILAILAHEVGHYKNRDMIRLMTTGSVLALTGFYISHLMLTKLSGLLGFEQIYDIGAAPLFIFSLFIFSLFSMPFSNMHSRRREFAADQYAIEKLGSSDALISAFEKLADQNLSNKEPAPWIEFMLHSHPSIARRIKRARELSPATE